MVAVSDLSYAFSIRNKPVMRSVYNKDFLTAYLPFVIILGKNYNGKIIRFNPN